MRLMHRLLPALMIMPALGAIAPGGAHRATAQPASTDADRALLARRLAARGLSEPALNGDTTLDRLTAALGWSGWTGPAREMRLFSFGGERDPPYQTLWLSFEAGDAGRLTRAILHTYRNQMFSTSIEIFNILEITKTRRFDQLNMSRLLTVDDVLAAWGPADGVYGSGFAFWEYRMAGGGNAALVFDGRCLLGSGPQSRRARRARWRRCHPL